MSKPKWLGNLLKVVRDHLNTPIVDLSVMHAELRERKIPNLEILCHQGDQPHLDFMYKSRHIGSAYSGYFSMADSIRPIDEFQIREIYRLIEQYYPVD